jgi:hypothetical protein
LAKKKNIRLVRTEIKRKDGDKEERWGIKRKGEGESRRIEEKEEG